MALYDSPGRSHPRADKGESQWMMLRRRRAVKIRSGPSLGRSPLTAAARLGRIDAGPTP
jgi:hypothetical protein